MGVKAKVTQLARTVKDVLFVIILWVWHPVPAWLWATLLFEALDLRFSVAADERACRRDYKVTCCSAHGASSLRLLGNFRVGLVVTSPLENALVAEMMVAWLHQPHSESLTLPEFFETDAAASDLVLIRDSSSRTVALLLVPFDTFTGTTGATWATRVCVGEPALRPSCAEASGEIPTCRGRSSPPTLTCRPRQHVLWNRWYLIWSQTDRR